jgi:hypothetical protein
VIELGQQTLRDGGRSLDRRFVSEHLTGGADRPEGAGGDHHEPPDDVCDAPPVDCCGAGEVPQSPEESPWLVVVLVDEELSIATVPVSAETAAIVPVSAAVSAVADTASPP